MKNNVTIRFIDAYNFLKAKNSVKSQKDFAEAIGISTSMMTEIVHGRSNVGANTLQNLVRKFPEISTRWLLDGNGQMCEKYSSPTDAAVDMLNEPEYAYTPSRRAPQSSDTCTLCQEKERTISSLQETIEVYRQSLLIMRQRIAELEEKLK